MRRTRGLAGTAVVVAALAVVASALGAAGDSIVPPDVRGLRAAPSYKHVTVTWRRPTYAGYDHVEIWEVIDDGTPVRVYVGKARSYTDPAVDNTKPYQFHVTTVDSANHYSVGDNVEIRPWTLLTAPAYGVQIDAPPLLRWARVPGARFYNVQLYQSGQKLLSSWPRGRSLQLRPNWHFNGRRRALRPGRIHWFVWPAFGTRANPQYGAQLGASAFVVPGNACTASLQSPSC